MDLWFGTGFVVLFGSTLLLCLVRLCCYVWFGFVVVFGLALNFSLLLVWFFEVLMVFVDSDFEVLIVFVTGFVF